MIFIGIIVGLGWYFRDWLAPQLEPYRPQAEAAWGWTQDRAQTAYGWCRNCYRNARERFGQNEIEAEPAVDPAEAIAEIAARYGLEVTYVDDQPVVAGNLKTRAERLSATAEAYAAMPCVELNISDDETLKTAVEDTLSLTGEIGLRVQTVTNRVAVLEGRCADFGAVMMYIAQEVPKLRGVIGDAVKGAGRATGHASVGRGRSRRRSAGSRAGAARRDAVVAGLRDPDRALSVPRHAQWRAHHGRCGDRRVDGSSHRGRLGGARGSQGEVRMAAVNEPVRLLEIEKDLAGPDRDAALARYDAVLIGVSRRIEAAMKEGLPPDEFARVEALREANTLARKILRLTARVGG